MTNGNKEPKRGGESFICPNCGAYAAMKWDHVYTAHSYQSGQPLPLEVALCHSCLRYSVWLNGKTHGYPDKMIYPQAVTAPLPNEDLPEDCRKDYMEARDIASNSPRGAAALLRVCIQKLVVHLGGNAGKKLDHNIGELVKNGLPQRVQQALDVVRVIGNNAVHPGELDVGDDPETVHKLFGLVNLIVDNQITQPKQVDELFSDLPEGARTAVEKRDKKE